jgi:hypothetical protein
MSMMVLPLAAELAATPRPPDPGPLLERLATLRLENATLRAENAAGRRRGQVWRHQVVELLPWAVRVTEYQMARRRCAQCGKRTRAELPAGVSRRPFGARLTAVIALRAPERFRVT